MTDDAEINEPTSDIVIERPYRGDIRCRNLTIGRSGSVFGNIIADVIRVAGRFDGTAHSSKFYSAPGSKVFGSVNAAEIGIKPGTSLHAHMGPEFPIPYHPAAQMAKSTEEAILSGIEQGARREIERMPKDSLAAADRPARSFPMEAAAAVAAAAASEVRTPTPRRSLPSIV